MAEQKMTRKQMFAHIAEVMADDIEVVDFCNHQIEMIDNRAAKPRKRKTDEKTVAFRAAVLEYMDTVEDEVAAKDVAAAMTERLGEEISVQKASAALRFLAGDGKINAFDNGSKAKTYGGVNAEGDDGTDDIEF
jgi:Fe2+ or Zn2+ uptake regulation protein